MSGWFIFELLGQRRNICSLLLTHLVQLSERQHVFVKLGLRIAREVFGEGRAPDFGSAAHQGYRG